MLPKLLMWVVLLENELFVETNYAGVLEMAQKVFEGGVDT